MKNALLSILMICSLCSCAQNEPDISGTYDRGQHGDPQGFADLFVLKNHTFAIVFFGGGVAGTWKIEQNQVIFTPYVLPQTFAIYGRHNPDLTDSTRMAFMGFTDDQTFVNTGANQNGKAVMKRVFNPNPNCLDFPNVTKFKGIQQQISFVNALYHPEAEPAVPQETYTFGNTAQYNDFISYYYTPKKSYRPFSASLTKGGLQFRGDEITAKKPLPSRKEDLEMLNSFQQNDLNPPEVQFNPYYGGEAKTDVTKDNLNYTYNKKKNAWISQLNYTEGEEYTKSDDAFNQRNIIYVFKAIKPVTSIKTYTIDEVPLFTRLCPEDK